MAGNAEGLKSAAFHASRARLPRVAKKARGEVADMTGRAVCGDNGWSCHLAQIAVCIRGSEMAIFRHSTPRLAKIRQRREWKIGLSLCKIEVASPLLKGVA